MWGRRPGRVSFGVRCPLVLVESPSAQREDEQRGLGLAASFVGLLSHPVVAGTTTGQARMVVVRARFFANDHEYAGGIRPCS